MGKNISAYVSNDVVTAIQSGVPVKWATTYEFLQNAILEKLAREGLLNDGK